MKDGPVDQAGTTARSRREPGPAQRRRDDTNWIQQKQGDVLGLRAFEKISAIEGIRLTGEMRKDLESLDARHMNEDQRSRFISGKYGQK